MSKETESIKKNLIPQNKVRPQIWVWLPDYLFHYQYTLMMIAPNYGSHREKERGEVKREYGGI